MDAKRKKSGFTHIEMLTVIGIIAILLGLILPSLTMVRRIAKETKQKAQLTTIALALEAFKNDYGDYPPSDWWDESYPAPTIQDYCGAQKLAEALLGRDLLGFNKYSNWSATDLTFYPTDPALLDASLDDRRGPYLELATANAFKLGDLFGWNAGDTGALDPDTFVICDIFGVKKITLANGETVKAGAPILYYRANTSSKTIEPIGVPLNFIDQIYNFRDNTIVTQVKANEDGKGHPLTDSAFFYYGDPTAVPPVVIGYIQDPKVTAKSWPYRPDSYILISAGADGLYGNADDITNFGN